jgi:hypothetical protein
MLKRFKPTAPTLKSSVLKVFDIPLGQLIAHNENPNEQNERTFDEIVERIRKDGFDEPIHVTPEFKNATPTGKYLIFSGHHRVKAATMLGMPSVPAIIREGWDQDRIDIELVSRNQLRGHLNPHKFSELWDRLKKRYDPEQLKQMMGLTEKKQFNALYKQMRDQLPEKAKQKLDEAKETINSIEDLSSVLNNIFRNHGSEVDHSFMVFTYGGKKHHYIQVDAATHKRLDSLKQIFDDRNINAGAFFTELLSTPAVDNVISKLATGPVHAKKTITLKKTSAK